MNLCQVLEYRVDLQVDVGSCVGSVLVSQIFSHRSLSDARRLPHTDASRYSKEMSNVVSQDCSSPAEVPDLSVLQMLPVVGVLSIAAVQERKGMGINPLPFPAREPELRLFLLSRRDPSHPVE